MELNLYASVCTESLLAQLYGTRTPPESLMKQLLSLRHTQTCQVRTESCLACIVKHTHNVNLLEAHSIILPIACAVLQ